MSKPKKVDWEEFIIACADYDLSKYEAVGRTPMHRILKRMRLIKDAKHK